METGVIVKPRKPWKHQRTAGKYAGRVDHPALFMEMRLGKTLVAILDILRYLKHISWKSVLITAPRCVLPIWRDELMLEGVPKNEITFLTGTRGERLDNLKRRASFCLFNREGHLWLPEVANVPWEVVVGDESTFLKAPPRKNWSKGYGKRPNTAQFFIENFRDARRYALSGLPAPESELDLWSQLQFLDPMILGCKSYDAFEHKYFIPCGPGGHDRALSSEGRDFLQARLSTWCFSLSRKDVNLDVPKIYERRLVNLPADIRRAYETAEHKYILEINGKVKAATNFAIQSFIWLRRLCGGMFEHPLHREKMNVLLDLLRGELRTDIVVVYATFIAEVEWIYAELIKEKVNTQYLHGEVPPSVREVVLTKFRAGQVRVLVVQPECFKYGIDLSVSDTIIYYSSPLGLESRMQSEDRVINVRTKHPALIIDLLADDTVDEDIYESLAKKETRAELLRRIMRRGTSR